MGTCRPKMCHLKLIVSYSDGCRRNFQDTAGRYVTQFSLEDSREHFLFSGILLFKYRNILVLCRKDNPRKSQLNC